ncbi:hypothetical protein RF11_01807 [Thelohanellus kitauei]|uniref:Uncharacterized protein n=1 Tax=Thelohanellus kitauei TaxID=669202 RepID=A0A0C2JXF6_THEKT|nr:hypothetical protein RF11_01807 [Thelohanellus kitauei]
MAQARRIKITMNMDEDRLVNYAIKTLRDSEDDNQRIATLFLVLKLNPEKLRNHHKFVDLYMSITPSFIYRLLKSSMTESPELAEIELGLEILSYFLVHPRIAESKEIGRLVECCINTCRTGLADSKDIRACLHNIISYVGSMNPKAIMLKDLIKYFQLIQYSSALEADRIIENCKIVLSKPHQDTLGFVADVCECSKSLKAEVKFKTYDLLFLGLSRVTGIPTHFDRLGSMIDHVSLCLKTSNPVHGISIQILALLFTHCPFGTVFQHVKNKSEVDLWLSLCLIEIDLFLNKMIVESKFVGQFPVNIESSLYVIEILVNQTDYELCPKSCSSVVEFSKFILQILRDHEVKLFDESIFGDITTPLYRIICFTIAGSINNLEFEDFTNFFHVTAKIIETEKVENDNLVRWILPLLSNIPDSSSVKYFTVDDRFTDVICTLFHQYAIDYREDLCFVNSEVFENFLLGIYRYVSHEAIGVYDFGSLHHDIIQFCEACQNKLMAKNEALAYMLGTYLCHRNILDTDLVKSWLSVLSGRKILNIIDLGMFSLTFLEELVSLLKRNPEFMKDDFAISQIERSVYLSK